jgi:hypothetical protein
MPIKTVGSPGGMILFRGGNGTIAPGSVTKSPTRAAGLPPMRTIPDPPSGTAVVIPGPCGVPEHTGGGALGIGHVCWSPMRHAGFPPIKTVGQAGPRSGEPCEVKSPSLAAGFPMNELF